MKVPFADLAAQHKEIAREITAAIQRVIKKNDYILGEDVVLFEEEFAAFCGVRHAVGVSSGTAALFLALASLDIKEGHEVIVPDFTYIATALAVSYTGARPVFVDVNESTYTIDTQKLKDALTPRTRAIISVHLYGQPADMPEIQSFAREHNLKVIEDAAQAHGAIVKMKDGGWHKTGALGDIGCFSFYPSKNLGGLGDGGMVTTNSDDIYRKLLMLRDYGRVSKYEHSLIGYNSRLDTLQAAVLRVKLPKLTLWNDMRRSVAKRYDRLFKKTGGVITPYAQAGARHVYHVYCIRTRVRQLLMEIFKEKDISAIIHYPIPLHLQKAYAPLGYKKGDFPVSEKLSGEVVSLPMYPHMSEKETAHVVDAVKAATGTVS